MLLPILVIAAGVYAITQLTKLSVTADRSEVEILGVDMPKIRDGKVVIPVALQFTNAGDATIKVTSLQGKLKVNGVTAGSADSYEGITIEVPGRTSRTAKINLGIPLLQVGAAIVSVIGKGKVESVSFEGFYKANGFDNPLRFDWKPSEKKGLEGSAAGINITGTGRRLSSRETDLNGLIADIKLAYRASLPQVKELAASMRTGDVVEDGRRIYQFILDNLRYTRDPDGREVVRTSAATWREKKGDCEDFTILASALAKNMGYKPVAEVVGFYGSDVPAHIYATIKDAAGTTVVIDPCPYSNGQPVPFNTRAAGITSTQFVPMESVVIDGVGRKPARVVGLSGVSAPATIATQKLMARQSEYLRQSPPTQAQARELRKLRFGIKLNDSAAEQAAYTQVYDAIWDITNDGQIQWKAGTDLEKVAEIITATRALADNGFQDRPLAGIDFSHNIYDIQPDGSIGKITLPKVKLPTGPSVKNFIQNTKQAVTTAVQNAPGKIATAVKNTAQAAAQTGSKVLSTINTINPATVGIREALKAALRDNVAGIATKLRIARLSPAEAAKRGFDATEHAKLAKLWSNASNLFEFLGSDIKNIEAIIDATPLNGIGFLPLALPAAASLAKPLIEKLLALFKGINFDKLTAGVKAAGGLKEALKADKVPELEKGTKPTAQGDGFASEAEKNLFALIQNNAPAPEGDTAAKGSTDTDSTASSLPAWLLPAAGGLLLLLLI